MVCSSGRAGIPSVEGVVGEVVRYNMHLNWPVALARGGGCYKRLEEADGGGEANDAATEDDYTGGLVVGGHVGRFGSGRQSRACTSRLPSPAEHKSP